MMRSRNRKKISKGSLFTEKNKQRFVILFALKSIVFGFFVWRSLSTVGFWKGNDTLSVVYTAEDSVIVSIFDPVDGRITNIVIPGDTEVEAARNLGTWKLKSLWELGKDEGYSGKLLADSVVKNFHMPVVGWSDKPGYQLVDGGYLGLIRAVLLPYDTNLSQSDRLRMALFSIKVSDSEKETINLADTGFIKKAKLTDGETGYKIANKMPASLFGLFRQEGVESGRAVIKYGLKNPPGDVSEVVEVLGVKVSTYEKQEEITACQVLSMDLLLRKKIADVFSCTEIADPPSGNYQLEIRLGKDFTW